MDELTYDELEATYLEHPETCDCESCEMYLSISDTNLLMWS